MTAVIVEQAVSAKQLAMEGSGGYRVPWETHETSMQSQVKQPSFAELCAACIKYGSDGVLESALHLADADFTKLVDLCAKTPAHVKRAKS